jgi:undecaprenyl-diphosphatase
LGLLWLIIGISISESLLPRYLLQSAIINTARTKTISAAILLVQLIFYLGVALHYHPSLNLLKDESPLSITQEPLTTFREKNLPQYTETLLGKNQMPLDFMIIAKDDAQFIQAMQKAGWYLADQTDYASLALLAKSALIHERYPTAPLTPSFWDAKVQDLGFEKPVSTQRFRRKHRARFWRTHLQASAQGRVYVGAVARDKSIKWLTTHVIDPDIDAEREFVFENLKNTGWILDYRKEQFVEPILGAETSNNRFFTDGRIYLITLK